MGRLVTFTADGNTKKKETGGRLVRIKSFQTGQPKSFQTSERTGTAESGSLRASAPTYTKIRKQSPLGAASLGRPASSTKGKGKRKTNVATATANQDPDGRVEEMYRLLATARKESQLKERARQAAVDLDTETLNRVNRQLKDLRAAQGKQTLGDRASDTLSAVFSGSAGSYTNAAGFALDLLRDLQGRSLQIAQLKNSLKTGRTGDGRVITESQRKAIQEAVNRWDSTENPLYGAADRMQRDSARFQAQAKAGLGSVGGTVVDAATSMGQSMLDAGLGLATGTGMAPFVVRSLGGAT